MKSVLLHHEEAGRLKPDLIGSMLTDRQEEVLTFLRDFKDAHGFPPTVREIGEHLGISSPNGVMCHLNMLVRKGRITRDLKRARGICLVGQQIRCPCCGQVFDSKDAEAVVPENRGQTNLLDPIINEADLCVLRR